MEVKLYSEKYNIINRSRGRSSYFFGDRKALEVKISDLGFTIFERRADKDLEVEMSVMEMFRLLQCAEEKGFVKMKDAINVFERKKYLDDLDGQIKAINSQNKNMIEALSKIKILVDSMYEN